MQGAVLHIKILFPGYPCCGVNRPGFSRRSRASESITFKLYRRELVARTMQTLHVVEHLYVVECVGPRINPRRIDLALDPLALQELEEALGHRVIVTVAAPTRTLGKH